MIMNKAFSSLLSPTGCAQNSDAKEKPFDEKAIRSRRKGFKYRKSSG